MAYVFQDLPYAYSTLAPVVDEQTMRLHKDKHHRAYYEKFVGAIEKTDMNGKPITEVLANISQFGAAIRNNGGGYFNHDLYFGGMRAPREDNAPSGALLHAMERAFGGFAPCKEALAAAAANQFGSGWGWLIVKDGALSVTHTPNQDNPLMDVADVQGTPILGCDVWEHAYYLTYQNRRPDYIKNWWKVVNWDFVAGQYTAAL